MVPPLAEVIDPDGTVTAQWQGEMNYEQVLAAPKAARLQPAAKGGLRE